MPKWLLFALATAGMWGMVPILEKTGIQTLHPAQALFLRMFGGVIGLILVPLFKPDVLKNLHAIPIHHIGALVLAGFLGSVAGQLTNLSAQKLQEVSRIGPIIASWPVITFFLAVLLLHEKFTLLKLFATLLIVSGIILISL